MPQACKNRDYLSSFYTQSAKNTAKKHRPCIYRNSRCFTIILQYLSDPIISFQKMLSPVPDKHS